MAVGLARDAARWDQEARFPTSSVKALREARLLDLTVPKEYDGQGLGTFEACLVLEEIAAGCMASAMVAQMFLNGPPRLIARLGTSEQKGRYLPAVAAGDRYFAIAITEPAAGSAATDLATELRPGPDGLRLHGRKCYITGAREADAFVVFCRAAGTVGARGLGAVIVERGWPGFSVGPAERKMGARGVAEADLIFEECAVAEDHVLIRCDPASSAVAGLMLRQFNPERCGNAAMCLGVARAALEEAVAFARERRQHGRSIAEFQGIQWMVADMTRDLEAARLLVWRAALSDEGGFPAMRETAMAKIAANEAAQRVTNGAIQILGHRGVTLESAAERRFRDVRGMALAGGTTEIMRNLLGGQVLAVRPSQRERPEVATDRSDG